jgi:large subunit ribosomal protein L11
MEIAKVKGGSPESNRKKIGSVSWDQVNEIASDKMQDMNAFTIDAAMSMVAGTARSMGITVEGTSPLSK